MNEHQTLMLSKTLFTFTNIKQQTFFFSFLFSSDKMTNNNTNMTVKDLTRSPFLWVVSVSYMVVFCSKTALSDWGQIYLIEELGRSQMQGKLGVHGSVVCVCVNKSID